MSDEIDAKVDALIDTRGGKALLPARYDDVAVELQDSLYRSNGTTAAHMLVLPDTAGRVIVNTGMGYEAVHHKRLFDSVCAGPTPYIVTTQAHVDHVGGVGLFREPGTVYVAQANNQACQADDARIQQLRSRTAAIWFDVSGVQARQFASENPGVPMRQDRPVPDVTFERRLGLRAGTLELDLIAAPGGETIDSCIVWLPQPRVAVISNLLGPLFPHFPNFNTLRGDKYRFVEPYLAAVRTLRELQPEVLITGRGEPVRGAALIDRALARLHAAVDHVHRETLAGMNTGTDVLTLMREIRLPDHLRVGQGYGKVSWAVRTIWESYVGWFRLHSSTELYDVDPRDAIVELVDVVGADAAVARAEARLASGEAVLALLLAEAVLAVDAQHVAAVRVAAAAHESLLASGGDVSFWESGWLRHQLARYQASADGEGEG